MSDDLETCPCPVCDADVDADAAACPECGFDPQCPCGGLRSPNAFGRWRCRACGLRAEALTPFHLDGGQDTG